MADTVTLCGAYGAALSPQECQNPMYLVAKWCHCGTNMVPRGSPGGTQTQQVGRMPPLWQQNGATCEPGSKQTSVYQTMRNQWSNTPTSPTQRPGPMSACGPRPQRAHDPMGPWLRGHEPLGPGPMSLGLSTWLLDHLCGSAFAFWFIIGETFSSYVLPKRSKRYS